MITRIVKMQFSEEFVEEFKLLFTAIMPKILGFDGCSEVKLWQDEGNPHVFFTISKWQSSEKLNDYRSSDLFVKTWSLVKPNFTQKAEAWSLTEI